MVHSRFRWRLDPAGRLIVSGALASFFVRIAATGLGYAVSVLLSRSLGIAEFGRYSIALGWALVLTIPTRAGFDNSILRFGSVYQEMSDHGQLKGILGVGVATVVAAWGFVTIFGVAAGRQLGVPWSQLLGALTLVLPLCLLAVFSSLLRVTRNTLASLGFEQVLRPAMVLALVAGCLLLRAPLDAASAIWWTTGGALLALIAQSVSVLKAIRFMRMANPSVAAWREWIAFSVPMLLVAIIQELLNQIDVILLGHFGTVTEAAQFAAAWRVAALVAFALNGLAFFGGPLIATAFHRGDDAALQRIASQVARVGFAFAIVASVGLIVIGPWLLSMFGRDFAPAYPVLLVLLVGGLANAFTGLCAYLMTLTGHHWPAILMFIAALLITVVLDIILIPRLGAVGAGIASSTALTTWNLAMLIYVRVRTGIDSSPINLRSNRRYQRSG